MFIGQGLGVDHMEEQKSERPTKELPYFIDIVSPGGQSQTIPFTPKLIVGGSEDADIVFKEFELKTSQCIDASTRRCVNKCTH